jgi:hypothetical protein
MNSYRWDLLHLFFLSIGYSIAICIWISRVRSIQLLDIIHAIAICIWIQRISSVGNLVSVTNSVTITVGSCPCIWCFCLISNYNEQLSGICCICFSCPSVTHRHHPLNLWVCSICSFLTIIHAIAICIRIQRISSVCNFVSVTTPSLSQSAAVHVASGVSVWLATTMNSYHWDLLHLFFCPSVTHRHLYLNLMDCSICSLTIIHAIAICISNLMDQFRW